MTRQPTILHALRAAFLFCLLAASPTTHGSVELASKWDEPLAQVSTILQQGDFKQGHRRARKLVKEMLEHYGAFEASPRPMAQAAGLLAIAESGLEKRDDAAWHWRVALNLDERIQRHLDLPSYGRAGLFLLEVDLRDLGAMPLGYPDASRQRMRTTAPVAQESLTSFTTSTCQGLRYSRENIPHPISVEFVITAQGTIDHPRLFYEPRFPGWAYNMLEQLRDWRFEPALFEGEPVAMLYEATIPYSHSRW